jgi:hypothetical protein
VSGFFDLWKSIQSPAAQFELDLPGFSLIKLDIAAHVGHNNHFIFHPENS